jgi:hypothetical protein
MTSHVESAGRMKHLARIGSLSASFRHPIKAGNQRLCHHIAPVKSDNDNRKKRQPTDIIITSCILLFPKNARIAVNAAAGRKGSNVLVLIHHE